MNPFQAAMQRRFMRKMIRHMKREAKARNYREAESRRRLEAHGVKVVSPGMARLLEAEKTPVAQATIQDYTLDEPVPDVFKPGIFGDQIKGLSK